MVDTLPLARATYPHPGGYSLEALINARSPT
jgi:DNA polymerase III epsilon subunit-like protein